MSIYPSHDFFFTAFSEKQLRTTHSRNKKILRYILFEIEQHKSGNAFDFSNTKYSIEHILPENPEKGLNHFDNTTHERMVYRLGNMILMNTKDN
uniref:GmrSD restriction endonucleases C-terminal domain-containing protein n=1 Tax=Arsenophonus endosymbiont of Trialeurodes vaporariorum TaxID=235567 RepID=A0A3B0MMH1_9GAMM